MASGGNDAVDLVGSMSQQHVDLEVRMHGWTSFRFKT
jgi:hypothetical protein